MTEVCTFSTIGAVHKIVRAAGCLSSLVFSSYSSVVEHWWLKLGTLGSVPPQVLAFSSLLHDVKHVCRGKIQSNCVTIYEDD